MTVEPERRSSSRSRLLGLALRLLALVLFLAIGWLTIPKLAPRMHRLFSQREDRSSLVRKQAHDAGITLSEEARPGDVQLIVGATLLGAVALGGLGCFALRSSRDASKDAGSLPEPREEAAE